MLSNYLVHLATVAFLLLLVSDEVKLQQTVATTECPSTFKQGVNLVRCTIYGGKLACNPAPTKIQIYVTKNGASSIYKDTAYPPTPCTSTADTIPEGDVGCTEQTGDTYTYLYKFMVESESTAGTSLQCRVTCLGGTAHAEGEPCAIKFPDSDDDFNTPVWISFFAFLAVAAVVCPLLVLHFYCGFKGQWGRKCGCKQADLSKTSDAIP